MLQSLSSRRLLRCDRRFTNTRGRSLPVMPSSRLLQRTAAFSPPLRCGFKVTQSATSVPRAPLGICPWTLSIAKLPGRPTRKRTSRWHCPPARARAADCVMVSHELPKAGAWGVGANTFGPNALRVSWAVRLGCAWALIRACAPSSGTAYVDRRPVPQSAAWNAIG